MVIGIQRVKDSPIHRAQKFYIRSREIRIIAYTPVGQSPQRAFSQFDNGLSRHIGHAIRTYVHPGIPGCCAAQQEAAPE